MIPRYDQVTHFKVADSAETLCGLVATALLDRATVPSCGTCLSAWSTATGWAFPLPSIACVDA